MKDKANPDYKERRFEYPWMRDRYPAEDEKGDRQKPAEQTTRPSGEAQYFDYPWMREIYPKKRE